MTNRQAKLCRIILKKKNLADILKKSKISDYIAFQEEFSPGDLDFSNVSMDETTIITLSNQILSEYEERNRLSVDQTITRILSIIAIIISVIALFQP